MIPEELDLSRIDRTLGGSVRSLPSERSVIRSRAAFNLFSPFPSRQGTHIFARTVPCTTSSQALAIVQQRRAV